MRVFRPDDFTSTRIPALACHIRIRLLDIHCQVTLGGESGIREVSVQIVDKFKSTRFNDVARKILTREQYAPLPAYAPRWSADKVFRRQRQHTTRLQDAAHLVCRIRDKSKSTKVLNGT